MAKKNAYLERQNAIKQKFLDVGEEIGMQKMWDYVQIALRDPEIMGREMSEIVGDFCSCGEMGCSNLCENGDCIIMQAANAIETLQSQLEDAKRTANFWEQIEKTSENCIKNYDAENKRLEAENAQLRRELEAAVADLKEGRCCSFCSHVNDTNECECDCEICEKPCTCYNCHDGDKFEWRGVQEDKA